MKVAVIGGGPSGLVTLKFLLEAHKYFDIPPIDARLFESEEKIGGTFVWRIYEDAELVSSKYLTAFSDYRFSPTAPDFVTPEQYVQYLNEYASHFVKVRGQFGHNSNVVILGAGETAMDIGYLAITAPTRSVSICHRGGFFCAPKVIPVPQIRGEKVVQTRPNKPSDCSVASLFDTAYTHPTLQRSPLLWLVYDRWVKGMHMLISGTEEGPDQWVGHMSSERKYVDSIFMYVLTWPEKFDDHGAMVVMDDDGNTKRIVPDVIVLATGYRTSFPFLNAEYPGLGEADHKFRSAVPTIVDPNALESYELDWKLQPRAGYDLSKTKGGVDHESYAYQLALDIGAAPRVSYIMGRGLKVCFTWAMGSNFNTKFRLVGPWKWEGAAEIIEGELFDVVKRSGGLVYLFSYTIAPLILFGTLSIMLYLITALPSEDFKVLEIVPNITISLGKYGSFPSNLIIDRPYHLTYEIQDKREDENFARLRVVPAAELNADALADTSADAEEGEADEETIIRPSDGEELTLVDEASGQVVIRSKGEAIDESARQTLTIQEIEELKKKGTAAGKELIAKLLLSHTAIEEKTAYSLAKYKLLKTKKYIRRFTVLPLDVPLLAKWMLEDKDASKIMEMRNESMALVGCWADVHYVAPHLDDAGDESGGRWLVVDDTGGLLTASLAERMGILHENPDGAEQLQEEQPEAQADAGSEETRTEARPAKRRRPDDLELPFAKRNTLTILHHNTQPNLFLLRYFNFDSSDPDPHPPYHPLFSNMMYLSWLQLLNPEEDITLANPPEEVAPEVLASWKTNRRGNHHRKRRRWARTRHIVDSTRAGSFSGLAVASPMDPVSILRHTLPLLAPGAPIAIYSPSIEPLNSLVDCFSVGRRAAWITEPPKEAEGKAIEELERWEGNAEYPLNPTLILNASIQTSRAKRWQVLPGRTHPVMTAKGGAEGYIFTGWRALPVAGKIEARGKFNRKKGDPK
ncbi:unnamed protein product [Clonostachys solani]|uniref:tRNA (adenine(58)-N(1))-methyltransferase non-catalytic subunit TRM6 n=1 Tax=Clonostachys solani TaxID=160281 RepID=A0A9P0ESF3_9HYPO|nr:unnamed protein product [Clonostachys solani]